MQNNILLEEIHTIDLLLNVQSIYWNMSDRVGDIVMINVNEQYKDLYPWLRGVVIDVKDKIILTSSFGFPMEFVGSHIELTKDVLQVKDNKNDVCSIPFSFDNTIDIYQWYEGTLLRVFKWKGLVFYATHKKLEGKNHWASSKSFYQIFKEMDGPSEETLFSSDSNIVYQYILCHPDLLMVSQVPLLTHGYLVYLDSMRLITGEILPAKKSLIFSPEYFPKVTQHTFPQQMDIETTNRFLNNGYWLPDYNSNNLKTNSWDGEAILIIQRKKSDHSIINQVRVNSKGYQKRLDTRGQSQSLKRQLYNLYNCSYNHLTEESFINNFIRKFDCLQPFHANTIETICKNSTSGCNNRELSFYSHNFSVDKRDSFLEKCKTRGFRFAIIWSCFLLSVPLCRRAQIIRNYREFYSEIQNFATYLIKNGPFMEDETKKDDEAKNIANHLLEEISWQENTIPPEKQMFSLLKKQRGNILFTLISLT